MLNNFLAQDNITRGSIPHNHAGLGPRVAFRHKDMFVTAMTFDRMVSSMIHTSEAERCVMDGPDVEDDHHMDHTMNMTLEGHV